MYIKHTYDMFKMQDDMFNIHLNVFRCVMLCSQKCEVLKIPNVFEMC